MVIWGVPSIFSEKFVWKASLDRYEKSYKCALCRAGEFRLGLLSPVVSVQLDNFENLEK